MREVDGVPGLDELPLMVKPIHVLVAEALGFPAGAEPCEYTVGGYHFNPLLASGSGYNEAFSPIWRDYFDYGERHGCGHGSLLEVPWYDRDWEVIGPQIARFELSIVDTARNVNDLTSEVLGWVARRGSWPSGARDIESLFGSTHQLAACNWILYAKEKGYLDGLLGRS